MPHLRHHRAQPDADALVAVQALAMGLAEGEHATSEVLGAICAAVGRTKATAIDVSPGRRAARLDGTARLDPDLVAVIERDYSTPDQLPPVAIAPRMQPRSLDHFTRYTSWEEIRATPFYADFWAPSRVEHAGIVLFPLAGGGATLISLGCDAGAEYFDAAETRWLLAATSAFAAGAALRLALEDARAAADLAPGADVVLLLDPLGAILKASPAAEALLDEGAVLRRRGRGVDAACAEAAPRLRAAVVAATCGATVRVALPGGTVPLRAEVSPGPRYRGQASVLVAARTPRPPKWCHASLRAAFDLTPREADVALGLARGLTPAEIAARCGLQPASVRHYLKRVLAKTDTRSQAQLVARLLAPHGLPVGPGTS